ncbi:MAG: hypothetical protein NTX96_00585 [Candidatus Zambryskibacteria bacterium]|nr:hypothetical protein [Candidatus Zambryskibacteria bacterium]
MKKYVTTSLFVFWAITVAVLVAGFISYNNSQSITGSNVGSTNQTGGTVPGINSNTTQKTLNLTMTELAKHNSSQSCWLLISGKIYDVTSYLNQHPGNASNIQVMLVLFYQVVALMRPKLMQLKDQKIDHILLMLLHYSLIFLFLI